MISVQDGSHQAFTILVRRHSSRFYAAAYRMCSDMMMAEDIVQEAFLKLWNKPQSWDADRKVKFTTWFYKVVTNLALDKLRQRKKTTDPTVLDFIEDPQDLPDEEAQNKQQQETLEDAIQDIPERQKAALNLCFYEGLSNKEAAEILGVQVKALESLLMRAKAGLRERFERCEMIEKKKENASNA